MRTHKLILWLLLVGFGPAQVFAQGIQALSLEEAIARDVNAPREKQGDQFPPHKIIGNLYYVGTYTLSAFLITTPQGHILINSTYERTVPVVRKSVEALGFRFQDIKILLGSHAHGDHMEGNPLVKQLTGAQVMAMEQDIPALERIRPGGKAQLIDRVLRHGDQVTFGGMILVAQHTPGHTDGNTTWTFKVQEGGRAYDVVIIGAMGGAERNKLVENGELTKVAKDFAESFKRLRSLPCDVPLGSHPAMHNMAEKHAYIGKGSNPFIDAQGYRNELDTVEKEFLYHVEEQRKAPAARD